MSSLTPRQAEVLAFIRECLARDGRSPSIREIGERFQIGSTNGVKAHIGALIRKGALTQANDGSARSIRPTGDCCPTCGREYAQ